MPPLPTNDFIMGTHFAPQDNPPFEPFDIFDDSALMGIGRDFQPGMYPLGGAALGDKEVLDVLISDLASGGFEGNSIPAVPLPTPIKVTNVFAAQMAQGNASSSGSESSEAPIMVPTRALPPKPPSRPAPKPRVKREKRTKEQRQQRRREKQRIIARNFRKRKKENLRRLQEEVKRLRTENETMRQELGKDTGADAAEGDTQIKTLRTMVEAGDEAGIVKVLAQKDAAEKAAHEKKAASIRYHLEQLKAHLRPSELTKMTILGLSSQNAVAANPLHPMQVQQGQGRGEMWDVMCASLSLSPRQQRQMLQKQAAAVQQQHSIRHSSGLLAQLDQVALQTVELMAREQADVTAQLTPLQRASHLLWKQQNKPCMQMMNCMWKMTSSVPAAAPTAAAFQVKMEKK